MLTVHIQTISISERYIKIKEVIRLNSSLNSLQEFMIFVHYSAYRMLAQPREQSPTHSYTVHLSAMLSQKHG